MKLCAPHVTKWIPVFRTFILGQSAIQVINAVIGILLVRWMTVEQFAQYTLANSFQSSARLFIELGLSSALVALVGKDIHDKKRIGKLIAAGSRFRMQMFWVVGPVCAITFPIWFSSRGWPLSNGLLLTAAIIGYLFVAGLQAYYRPPLQMHRELGTIYKITLATTLLRLAIVFAAHLLSALSAPVAAVANLVTEWMNGRRLKNAAAKHFENEAGPTTEERREMLSYIRPLVPGVIFFAISGQINVFVISIFGETSNIAEVGALSRLGMIFAFFKAASEMLFNPYIAKQRPGHLGPRFAMIAGFGAIISLFPIVAVFLFPSAFLWILGPNYSDSQSALQLLIIGSSVFYLAGVISGMNRARKWVYWWDPTITIPGMILANLAGALTFDISTTVGIFQMALLPAVFGLLTRLMITTFGFRYENDGARK